MTKYFLVVLGMLCSFSLRAQSDVKITQEAIKDIAVIVSKEYFETKKNGSSIKSISHLETYEQVYKQDTSWFKSKNHVLRWTIDNLNFLLDRKRLSKALENTTVEEYLNHVISVHIHSNLSKASYFPKSKIDNIILLAQEQSLSVEYNNNSVIDNDTVDNDVMTNNTIDVENKGTEVASINGQDTTETERPVTSIVTPIEKASNTEDDKPDKNSTGNNDWLYFLLGICSAAIMFLAVTLLKRQKLMKETENKQLKKTVATSKTKSTDTQKDNPIKGSTTQQKVVTATKAVPTPKVDKKVEWIVVGESVIGKSHIQMNIECQDNHFFEKLNDNWYLAVVADGAGSAKKSSIGSRLVAKLSVKKAYGEILSTKKWFTNGEFPDEEEWKSISKEALKKIYKALVNYTINRNDTALKELACTVIVALVRPDGILVSHIGDGRAGYKNNTGEWKAMITPFSGEEANSTVFITSDIWSKKVIDQYIESRVIKENITAFTLLSDGCETHAFECSKMDAETQKWTDLNRPFPKFYESVISTLIGMDKENMPEKEMQKKWKIFLEKGTKGLENEPDDKTMIVGVLKPNTI